MSAPRPVPNVSDRDTAPLFDAALQSVLAVVVCSACDQVLHPPRGICDACGSSHVTTRATSGKGTVYTWTVVEHQVHPAFEVPYTIVVVELDDPPGVRFVGHLDGRPELQVGTPVTVTFTEVAQGVVRPDWRVDAS